MDCNSKHIFILGALCLLSWKPLTAQCAGPIVEFFPGTLNGVTVTQTYTGSVDCCGPPYTSCGVTSGRIGLGGNSPTAFIQKLSFSAPVNNVIYILTASDSFASGAETFTFTVDAGVLTATQYSLGCLFTQSGNNFSANISGANGNGAYIILTSSLPYNSITVSGPGGNNGSIMGLCPSLVNGISSPNNEAFTIGPNPNQGKFIIEHSLRENATLHIIDSKGFELKRVQLSPAMKSQEINSLDLLPGVYFYKLTGYSSILKSGKIVILN